MIKNRPKAYECIDHSFLSEGIKTAYKGLLDAKYEQLGLSE
jgi:hypothetical protein